MYSEKAAVGKVRSAKRSKSSLGFTLIELLVVVAIIALLVSILLPALEEAREQGKIAVCASNQRQIALAHLTYADNFGQAFVTDRSNSVMIMTKLYPLLLPYLSNNIQVLICPKDIRNPETAPYGNLDTYKPDGKRHICSYGFNAYLHMHYPTYDHLFQGNIKTTDVVRPSSVVLSYCHNWREIEYMTVGFTDWGVCYWTQFWGHGTEPSTMVHSSQPPGDSTVVALCDGHVETQIPSADDFGWGLHSDFSWEGTWFLPKPSSSYPP